MSLPSFTILFVDDSSEDRAIFQRYLRQDTLRTYTCLEAATGHEALQICAATPTLDCVVLDHSLPDMDGVELLKQLIQSCHPNAMAFVMVTGSGNEQVAVSALKQGAHDYLVKAVATPSDLQRAVANAIEKVQLHRILEEQRRQLREQHELLDRILETTTEGIMLIKPDRTVAQMNRRAETILGLDRAQVIGQPFQLAGWVVEVPDGSAWQTGALPIEQVLDTGQPVEHAILSLRRGPSEQVLLSVNAVPLRSLNGVLEGVIASFRDVTEQWQVEDAKRRQARDFQTTLNNMPAIVARFDRQLRHLYVNIEIERASGIAPDRFLGKTNRELGMPAELCDYWDAMLQRVFESGEPTTFQFVTPFVDRAHHFQSRVVPEFDRGGQVVSVLCVTLDQTEQREAEAALQTIADASAGLSLSLDLEATLTRVAEMLVPGHADRFTFDRLHADERMERLATAERGTGGTLQFAFQPHDASPDGWARQRDAAALQRPSASTSAGQSPDQHVITLPLVTRGITLGVIILERQAARPPFSLREQHLLEELGRRAATAIDNAFLYAEAQQAIRDREAFLSITSHELKNPLTSLLGRADLMLRRAQRTNLDERSQKDARIIVEQGRRMTTLLNDLLDVSRLDMGLLQIAHEPFDLAPIVQNVAHDAELLAREHQFVVEGTDQPALVRGDPLRVEQALRNLVGNAVKYSPDGGRVALTIVHEPDSVVVRVADQGIGIPPVEIPHLFKRFYRVDGGFARSIGGSGIGLYVVHQIVMLHGGTLSVESVEGAGSTFTMTLPVYLPERQSPETGA